MRSTIRQSILAALAANLSEIRTANGWNSDIGQTVVLANGSRSIDDMPCVWMIPGVETATVKEYGEDSIVLPVTLRAAVRYAVAGSFDEREALIAAAAEHLLGDLREVLASPLDMANVVTYSGGGVADWPDWNEGETALVVTVSAHIHYGTELNNPYQ